MFRRLSFGLLALPLGLAACGGGNTPPDKTDAGTVGDQPDPAYWALADKSCFEYENGYTLYSTLDKATIAGRSTYRLNFRKNGFAVREEWLEVRSDGLVLWRRTVPGDPFATPKIETSYAIFGADRDPNAEPPASEPPVFFPKNMQLQVPTISKALAKVSEGTTSSFVDYTVTFTKESDDTVEAVGAQQPASKIIFSVVRDDEGTGTADRFWFVPNLGLVKFDLSDTNEPVSLTKVHPNVDLGDCPPPPTP